MKHKIALLLGLALLSAAPSVSYAQQDASGVVDTSQLSAADQIRLRQARDAALLAAQQARTNTPVVQAERISEYAQIGKGIAQGLGAAAHELNVAVNDFAKTPVGQLTTWLIVYKVVGRDIIHYGLALLWIATSVPIWLFFYSKLWRNEKVVTEFYENGKKKLVTRTKDEDSEFKGESAVFMYGGATILPIAFIVIITFVLLP